jgi:hypothetical protein
MEQAARFGEIGLRGVGGRIKEATTVETVGEFGQMFWCRFNKGSHRTTIIRKPATPRS